MLGSTPLGNVFVSHLSAPCSVDPTVVGELLEEQLRSARQQWPGFSVDTAAFVAWLASKVPTDTDSFAHLRTLTIGDLYLTYACSQGNNEALTRFDSVHFAYVEQVLGRVKASPDQVMEIQQILRERFFVQRSDRPLGILSFTGRGSLRGWLRISALREFYRLTDQGKRSPGLEDNQLQRLAANDDDPELDHLKRRCQDEFRTAFMAALAALSVRQRNLLRHHYLDGMNVDEVGRIYRVHRATAARWIAKARAEVFSQTRQALMAQMQITQGEMNSVIRLVQSQMDLSLRTYLSPYDGG